MNSPFALLLQQLQQRISSTVPDITYIDQDLHQIDHYEAQGGRPAVSWPCVLIDFTDFNFENLGNNAQTATGNVVFRLAFNPYSASAQGTPGYYQERALQYYELEWALYNALEGWKPTGFAALTRIHSHTEPRNDRLRVRVQSFSLSFEDHSASPSYQTVQIPVNISVVN
ncbi:MAG: hypothetical protein WCG87_02960 [Bacteroidota bacterium]